MNVLDPVEFAFEKVGPLSPVKNVASASCAKVARFAMSAGVLAIYSTLDDPLRMKAVCSGSVRNWCSRTPGIMSSTMPK